MNGKSELYFFYAPWCHSCPKAADALKKALRDFNREAFVFHDIDVEDDMGVELSSKYQVRNVPTILIVKSDRVVERIVGTRSKEEIKSVLEKWK